MLGDGVPVGELVRVEDAVPEAVAVRDAVDVLDRVVLQVWVAVPVDVAVAVGEPVCEAVLVADRLPVPVVDLVPVAVLVPGGELVAVTVLVKEPVRELVIVAVGVTPAQVSPGCMPNQKVTVKLSAHSRVRVHAEPVWLGDEPVSFSGKEKPPDAAESASPASDHNAAVNVGVRVAVTVAVVLGVDVDEAVEDEVALGVGATDDDAIVHPRDTNGWPAGSVRRANLDDR
jgi:hypothetical protein